MIQQLVYSWVHRYLHDEISYRILIDTVLTMLGTMHEKEYERRIAAINAVIAVWMQKRVHPRGVVSPKNALPMMSICHQPPSCLKGRIQPFQIRATILFRRLFLRPALNLQQKDQRLASFALVALVCHKAIACGCTSPLDL